MHNQKSGAWKSPEVKKAKQNFWIKNQNEKPGYE